jgi:hypothetical protein
MSMSVIWPNSLSMYKKSKLILIQTVFVIIPLSPLFTRRPPKLHNLGFDGLDRSKVVTREIIS